MTQKTEVRKIPQFEPYFDDAEYNMVKKVLASGWVIEHQMTRDFEKAFARMLGIRNVMATTSGSIALFLVLKALGVGPGDEVVVPDFTFAAAPNAVMFCGARPVFADVDERGNVTKETVGHVLTDKTKAIIVTHINGYVADERLFEYGRRYDIIEDCAQAIGSHYHDNGYVGTGGTVSCWSLASSKHFSVGQGGLIATDIDWLKDRIYELKDHGHTRLETLSPAEDHYTTLGLNFKFTDIQAAIGLAQLQKLPVRLSLIWKIYHFYREHLESSNIRFLDRSGSETPWYADIFVKEPERLKERLAARGISTRRMYKPLHTHPLYAPYVSSLSLFRNSGKFYDTGLFLPSTTNLTESDLAYICDAVRECI